MPFAAFPPSFPWPCPVLSEVQCKVIVLQPRLPQRDGGNPAALCLRRWCMLRIAPLPRQDQRTLRQWQDQATPQLAQRAQLILWAAQGWSVPDFARVFHCCRRTVCRWLHAFEDQGLAGLQRHPLGQSPHARSHADSAKACDQTDPSTRLVPVVPLSVPEVRWIFNHLASSIPGRSDQFWYWSIYRRDIQALAMRSHYHKHGAKPPDLEYLRL